VLVLLDGEARMTTAADVLAVFPGTRLVTCLACGGTRWRRVTDREVCVVCHPAPGQSTPRWLPARRHRSGTPARYVAGPWQQCQRCGGQTFVHRDGDDDQCAECGAGPTKPFELSSEAKP
jgi:hypothetical protein